MGRAVLTSRGAGLLAALVLTALALRPQLVGVGPLIPEIGDDLEISHAAAGLLGTIPVLCMGVFAPPAALLSSRLGSRAAIGWCVAAIAAFGVARSLAPGAALVLALTFPIGVGMGLAGALLPVAVKERFRHRPAFATGIYATGINLGAALASVLAVPIAAALDGWRGALLVFSLVTVLLCGGWLWLTRRERPAARGPEDPVRPPRLPLRRPVVWLLVAVFALVSIVFYGLVSWLPDVYVERGWSDASAGALLGVLSVAALPASLLVPWLADRHGSRRPYLVGSAGGLLVASLGFVAVPSGAWVWTVVGGFSIGVIFPLTLTLPLDVADRPAQVGAVAGLMLGAGYTLSALGPLSLGAARDATGNFTLSLWLLVVTSAALVITCTAVTPARLHARAAAARAYR